MHLLTYGTLAVAIAAASSSAFASDQSESKGFVEDASLEVLNRNYYINADLRGNDADEQSYAEEWGHGVIGVFQSGYTQGTVGFGVDAIGLLGLKLDTGRGRAGAGLLELDEEGKARDEFSEFGAALKARLSNTELKFGSQFIELPVFNTGGDLLPEIAQGLMVNSAEIEGLVLTAGHITALSGAEQTDHDSIGLAAADVIGGTYDINDNLTAALYLSDIEDAFDKYYGHFAYTLPLSDSQELGLDFNLYQTDYDSTFTGTEQSEDNTIWSLAASYSVDAHTFTLAYQRSNGGYFDEEGTPIGYSYGIDGDSTIWLANSVQYSDFIYKDERSWLLGYDLNMESFGVPGLTFSTRYVYGDNIDLGDGAGTAEEREFDIAAQYVVQEGAAKDLSLTVEQAFYRADSALDDDLNELRLVVEYPLELL